MTKLEQEIKIEDRRAKIQALVLNTLYAAGVLSVALLAPNALAILKQIDRGVQRKTNPQYAIRRAVTRLTHLGLIHFKKQNGKAMIELTPLGKRRVELLHAGKILIKKPKRWDEKWRLVIFDIGEYRKNVRNKLRLTLTNLGFLRLQDSVWVYPYDCEELVTLLKADFKIGKDILYIIAQRIEYDAPLRKHFNL